MAGFFFFNDKLRKMQVFNCTYCGSLVFFDSVHCMQCGSTLGFVPDRMTMHALVAAETANPSAGLFTVLTDGPEGSDGRRYRRCYNYTHWNACNFAVPEHSSSLLCVACRQTTALPDLSVASNVASWSQLEFAKRQLFYTLALLRLQSVDDTPLPDPGPRYAFLADWSDAHPVMTGHANGTITVNIAEANDAERVRRRVDLHEPYRTLLGHMRHESGHYYWDRLIRDAGRQDAFRAVFGDEREDYSASLERHYSNGAASDWQARHVSAYAAAHAWEDWAETWAHYLHMIDLLETASAYHVSLALPRDGSRLQSMVRVGDPYSRPVVDFSAMVQQWTPLTLMLNSLNRSLGHAHAYPFALSTGAMEKLHFVHQTVQTAQPLAPPSA